MKKFKKYEIIIPICLIIFFLFSITSIYSSESILSDAYQGYYLKQLLWFGIGMIFYIAVRIFKNDFFYKYATYIYIISIVFLILVLFIGNEVNSAKAWISLGNFNFQPTEVAKFALIIFLSKILNDYHFKKEKNNKTEFILILKVILFTLIPSILAFIEPDTGSVITFMIIGVSMLFFSGIKLRWFFIFGGFILLCICFFIILYIKLPDTFINFFGNDIYYRIYRLIDWTNSSGMQLENSLIVISTSGLFGHGFNNIPLYFPEPYTDFIFSIFISNTGILGAVCLIITIIIFDYQIIKISINSNSSINKYFIGGFLSCLIYSQVQNICMTIGILPITGIPLPFISYGGSSLIIYLILTAFVMNTKYENSALKT